MSDNDSCTSISCRRANVDDVDIITQFNLWLALETEGQKLDVATMRQGVAGGLDRHPEVQYFVAETTDRVVGQLMVTREWSDWRNGWMLWLQSVYVVQEARSQGVFRRLLDYAMAEVNREGQAVGLRLYVERENEAAAAVYDRIGFKDAGYRLLEIVPLSQ